MRRGRATAHGYSSQRWALQWPSWRRWCQGAADWSGQRCGRSREDPCCESRRPRPEMPSRQPGQCPAIAQCTVHLPASPPNGRGHRIRRAAVGLPSIRFVYGHTAGGSERCLRARLPPGDAWRGISLRRVLLLWPSAIMGRDV